MTDQLTLFDTNPGAVILQLVIDNTPAAQLRRWIKQVLKHDCPTCKAPAGHPCRISGLRWPRDYHLTRADQVYRARRKATP